MLSAIIIAKNEAMNIRRCLSSLDWVDEIIVLDSGSTDNTVAIAREYTKNVYVTDWQGYGVQKQRALARATSTWILNIDADEEVSEPLKHAILAIMRDDTYDACKIPIRMCFFDKVLRFSSSPTRHARLFRREGAHFSADIVHEKIVLPASFKVKQLKAPLYHHSYRDISHVIEKLNRYSSYSAKIRIQANKSANIWQTSLSALWMFFRCYCLQAGFLDGKEGFVLALMNAHGTFYRGIKHVYPDKNLADLPNSLNHLIRPKEQQ